MKRRHVIEWVCATSLALGSLAAFAAVTSTAACNRTPRASRTNLTSAQAPPARTQEPSGRDECNAAERPLPNEALHEPAGLGGCPPGMAPIATAPGRCIDRWEAYLVELSPDGRERSVSPYFSPEERPVVAKSAPNAVPQGYIDRKRAERACERASKRLCTGEEWLAACRGPELRAYPYGREERLGTCNDHRDVHPVFDQAHETQDSDGQALQNACVNQKKDTVARTGAKPGCATPEQVYDLVGNLHEWTSDPSGAFRGGFYADTEANGRGCSYVTTAHDPTYWDYSTGFRCCADHP